VWADRPACRVHPRCDAGSPAPGGSWPTSDMAFDSRRGTRIQPTVEVVGHLRADLPQRSRCRFIGLSVRSCGSSCFSGELAVRCSGLRGLILRVMRLPRARAGCPLPPPPGGPRA
jgi:hypothetical protein